HHLTGDNWKPLSVRFSYDTASGLLKQVDLGLGSTYQLVSAAARVLPGLANLPPSRLPANQGIATLTDPSQHTTDYTLDSRGRRLALDRLLGYHESWQRDQAGQVTAYTDPLRRQTRYNYDATYKGDLLSVVFPDQTSVTYSYEHTFDRLLTVTDQRGNTTTNAYATQPPPDPSN